MTTAAATTTTEEPKPPPGDAGAGGASVPGTTTTSTAATTTDTAKGATAPKDGASGAKEGTAKETPENKAEALTLKFPEGFKAGEEMPGQVQALAKEFGLKGEQAQKVADLVVGWQSSQVKQVNASLEQTQKQWVEAQKSDKEYGGANWEENVKIAHRAFDKFGSPELVKAIKSSVIGDHPDFVRFAYRVGKALLEDSVAKPGGAGAVTQTREQMLQKLYPVHDQYVAKK